MKKLILTFAIALTFFNSKAQLGHYILNFDSVTVIKRLKIINVIAGATTDSLVTRRANGNITRLHMNQLQIPVANVIGATKYYNGSGQVNQTIKKWVATVTPSTSSGYSVDISSAGFTTVLGIQLTAYENVATEKGAFVSGKARSTTAVTINTYRSKNTAVLLGGNVEGLEFHPTPANVTICVEVTGY